MTSSYDRTLTVQTLGVGEGSWESARLGRTGVLYSVAPWLFDPLRLRSFLKSSADIFLVFN